MFKAAGLLDPEFDDSKEEPSARADTALFTLRRRECYLTNIFGVENEDAICEFAKALDSEEDQRLISDLYTNNEKADMMHVAARFNAWKEETSEEQPQEADPELWALQDRVVARGWSLLRDHVDESVFQTFLTAIQASRSH
jgi:phage/plasmid-associated DNA primase